MESCGRILPSLFKSSSLTVSDVDFFSQNFRFLRDINQRDLGASKQKIKGGLIPMFLGLFLKSLC